MNKKKKKCKHFKKKCLKWQRYKNVHNHNQTLKLTWNCKYDKDIKMYIIITKHSSWHLNSISTLKTWNFLNKKIYIFHQSNYGFGTWKLDISAK